MSSSGLIFYHDDNGIKHEFLILSKAMSFNDLINLFAFDNRAMSRDLLADELYVKDILLTWLRQRSDVTITYIKEMDDLSMGMLVKRILDY
jgi:hypothetical protein